MFCLEPWEVEWEVLKYAVSKSWRSLLNASYKSSVRGMIIREKYVQMNERNRGNRESL